MCGGVAVLLALALTSGCEPGAKRTAAPDANGPRPAPAGLSTDRAAYAPGDSLVLRLVPATDVEYNLCHAVWDLERRRAGQWERHRGEVRFLSDGDRRRGVTNDVCEDIALFGRGGETARYAVRLSDRLAPGTYRFRAETRPWSPVRPRLASRDTLATAPFEIR